jgi:hypothetical protein
MSRIGMLRNPPVPSTVKMLNEIVECDGVADLLEGQGIRPVSPPSSRAGRIKCQERLGGLLKFYQRAA